MSLSRWLPRYRACDTLWPLVRMSEVIRPGSSVQSIHWPFSRLIPSCQEVFASPSMAIVGWNLARSPTTDEAVAPVSLRGTDTAGLAEVVGEPEEPPDESGPAEPPADGTTAREGFSLAVE